MVAVAARAFSRRARACANPDRWMGLLHWLGVKCDIANRIRFALKRDIIAREHPAHNFNAFAEAAASLFAWYIETGEFAGHVTLAQTQVEAAIGEYINRRRILGHMQRVV